jgi:hypothetical protein
MMLKWQLVKEQSIAFWTIFFLGFLCGVIVGVWL